MKIEIIRPDRNTDRRGWLVEVLRDDQIKEEIKHIYLTVSKAGAIRGNHYHTRKTEWFCVMQGEAKLTLEDNKSGEIKELILSGDEPQTVSIPANVTHVVQNIGSGDMYMLAISDEVFDQNDPDTFQKVVI